MALLTWNKKYSVGIKALDDQHAEFLRGLNELHAAMLKGNAKAVAGPLLRRLTEGMSNHFSSEEGMMRATGYPGLARHHAAHQELNACVEEYVARHNRGDGAVYLEMLKFMREWLNRHVVEEDQKYQPWLNEHGVR